MEGSYISCPQNLAGYVLEEFTEDSELHNKTMVKPHITLWPQLSRASHLEGPSIHYFSQSFLLDPDCVGSESVCLIPTQSLEDVS